MKRFIIIILAFVVIFSSCQKLETDTNTNLVEVSFSLGVVSGNIPTKSFETEVLEFDNLFEYPTVLYFVGNSQVYTFDLTTGSTFSIQKGTYRVSGGYNKTNCITSYEKMPLVTKCDAVTRVNGKDYPGYTIEITDSKEYTIELVMTGFILACEKSKAGYFKYSLGGENNYQAKNLQESENYYYYIMAFGAESAYSDVSVHIDLEIGETENTEKCTKTARYYRLKDTGKYFVFYSPDKEMNSFNLSCSQSWTLGDYK